MPATVKETHKLLKNESFSSIESWLYHHRTILAKANVLTTESAVKELKMVAMSAIDKSDFMKAMNVVCRLNDIKIRPNDFYDANDYGYVPPKVVKKRLLAIE